MNEASIRTYDAIYQDVHHETWQEELESKEQLILYLLKDIEDLRRENESLRWIADFDERILADKEAEIVRLTTLLDAQSKKRR